MSLAKEEHGLKSQRAGLTETKKHTRGLRWSRNCPEPHKPRQVPCSSSPLRDPHTQTRCCWVHATFLRAEERSSIFQNWAEEVHDLSAASPEAEVSAVITQSHPPKPKAAFNTCSGHIKLAREGGTHTNAKDNALQTGRQMWRRAYF